MQVHGNIRRIFACLQGWEPDGRQITITVRTRSHADAGHAADRMAEGIIAWERGIPGSPDAAIDLTKERLIREIEDGLSQAGDDRPASPGESVSLGVEPYLGLDLAQGLLVGLWRFQMRMDLHGGQDAVGERLQHGIEGLDLDAVRIHLGDVCIVSGGGRADAYSDEAGQEVMSADEITVTIALGRGDAEETVWTSDLSHGYVSINAEYRT